MAWFKLALQQPKVAPPTENTNGIYVARGNSEFGYDYFSMQNFWRQSISKVVITEDKSIK